jgi:mannose-6-phosphate isomerase-like protein (cupin superfamily)
MTRTVNLAHKFSLFTEPYQPKIIGQLNDFLVKAVKVRGDFVWHHHDAEDELFLVTRGLLRMKLREGGFEREELVRPGEFIIVPRGVEETHVVLLEPNTTLNTGNVVNERTQRELEKI